MPKAQMQMIAALALMKAGALDGLLLKPAAKPMRRGYAELLRTIASQAEARDAIARAEIEAMAVVMRLAGIHSKADWEERFGEAADTPAGFVSVCRTLASHIEMLDAPEIVS